MPQHKVDEPEVGLRLTHPDRRLWEDAGITKKGLADYYEAVGNWTMPHVEDRILSLVRCPDGMAGKCFFAKHAWPGRDPSVKLIDVGDEKPMMMVSDTRGLIALVQMSVLEVHVWGSRAPGIERPDQLVFDLDPGDGVSWLDVKAAAGELRDRLSQTKLQTFLKTTGGKGLHVVVPIAPVICWDTAKSFSRKIAQQMVRESPLKYVASMAKSRRTGRVFIDYLRNSRGATAVAPYSTRARAGAPVAVPLHWEELQAVPSASHFTIAAVIERVSQHGWSDPWREFGMLRQKLPAPSIEPWTC